MEQRGKSAWPAGALLIICLAWLTALYTLAFPLPPLWDEFDIIDPALRYMTGEIIPLVKYPSFPFYFYGAFCKLFGTLDNREASVLIARQVNYGIFALNIGLVYLLSRGFLTRTWSLVAAFLFSTLPPVLFSAIYVKTEGLLLLELLLFSVALQKISEDWHSWGWHAVAGCCAALSISTKLNLLPLFLYLSANAYHYFLRRERIAPRAWVIFGMAFAAATLVSFTNLWIFDQVLAYWREDQYFLPGASPVKAITNEGLSAFPFGRYSSFASTVMPFSLGFINLFLLGSLIFRTLPRPFWWVHGVGTILSLITLLTVSPMRSPHVFTVYLPVFVIAGATFLHWVTSVGFTRSKALNRSIAGLLVAAAVVQSGWQLSGWNAFVDGATAFERFLEEKGVDANTTKILSVTWPVTFVYTAQGKIPASLGAHPDSLPQRIASEKPEMVFVFSSYVLNMCKYKRHQVYVENCTYFKKMLRGETPYKLHSQSKIPWKGFLLLDPEFIEMALYLFEVDRRQE